MTGINMAVQICPRARERMFSRFISHPVAVQIGHTDPSCVPPQPPLRVREERKVIFRMKLPQAHPTPSTR